MNKRLDFGQKHNDKSLKIKHFSQILAHFSKKNLLILYEPTLDTCFEINTISNYPEDAEMYFKNIFYSDDNENFKGLELFLNNCSKTVLNIDSTEIKKLLFYYDDNLFDPENVIDSIGELTTILNDQKLLLQSTDDDLLNCVLAKDVYPFARVKPTFLAVYHVGYRLFYVVGIYFDKPMAFKKGRFKTSIIPVFAKGVN